MKFEYSNRPVAVEGNIESSEFGATKENLPFLLNMLQTTLYSDKPLAVCREYITNAWDAHVDAGIPDTPIQITMPTSFSPVLKIRDFGKGLSKNDVFYHYTSYGDSGKRHTDDMVGGFGLGSKSAFCYVPSFTVISYHDGVKMTFNAQIEEKKTTMNHLMDLDEPTEESGMEIQISVKSYDIYSFRETLVSLLRFHKPVPTFTNNTYVLEEISKEIKVLLEGSNWKIVSPDYGIGNTVVLGNVPYSFNTSNFDFTFRDRFSQFGDLKFILFLKPNTLNVSLNREVLEYTDKTKANLQSTIEEAMREYEIEFTRKFDTMDSVYNAKKFMYTFRDNRVNLKPVVDGYTIKNTDIDLSNLKFESREWLNYNDRWSSKGYKSISCNDRTFIYIARPDIPKNSIRLRVKMHMDSNGYKKGYDNNEFVVFTFSSDADADDFLNSTHIRGANVIELNDVYLPKITKANVRTAMVKSEGYKFDTYKVEFVPHTVELNHGSGIYIPIAYNHASDKMSFYFRTNDSLKSIIKSVENVFDTYIDVIGIKNQEVSRLGKGWIRLDSEIQRLLDTAPYDVVLKLTTCKLMSKYNEAMFKVKDYISESHSDYYIFNRLTDYFSYDIQARYKSAFDIIGVTECKLPTWEFDTMVSMVDGIIEKYPILNLVAKGLISNDKEWEVVTHYLTKDQ